MSAASYQSFEHAEVSKALIAISSASTLAASFLSKKDFYSFSLNHIISKRQYWRLLTSHLIFDSPGELVLGILLMYQFRFFERSYGTSKYLGSVVYYLGSATVIQFVIACLSSENIRYPSGPYILLFALFVQYWRDVPRIVPARVLGIPVTNKMLVYFLGAQIIFGHSPGSFYSAGIGVALGLMYRMPFLPFSSFRAPTWICRPFQSSVRRTLNYITAAQAQASQGQGQRLIQPLRPTRGMGRPNNGYGMHRRPPPQRAHSAPTPRRGNNAGNNSGNNSGNSGNNRAHEKLEAKRAPLVTTCVPDESHVKALSAMGFSEAAARTALAKSNNNLVIATNRLAEGM